MQHRKILRLALYMDRKYCKTLFHSLGLNFHVYSRELETQNKVPANNLYVRIIEEDIAKDL